MIVSPIAASSSAIQAGEPTTLFQTQMVGAGGSMMKHQYSVATDGRFLFNVEDAAVSVIKLIVHWKPALQ